MIIYPVVKVSCSYFYLTWNIGFLLYFWLHCSIAFIASTQKNPCDFCIVKYICTNIHFCFALLVRNFALLPSKKKEKETLLYLHWDESFYDSPCKVQILKDSIWYLEAKSSKHLNQISLNKCISTNFTRKR